MGKKAFFYFFKIEKKNYFWISLTPDGACTDKFLSSLIKINRQLSRVMWIAVWFQLNERDFQANCSWSGGFNRYG